MKNKNIVIVDYGLGNLFSVKHACDYYGENIKISSDKNDIINADGIILPGVGAFGEAMYNLGKLDLIAPITDYIQSDKPFLGVCLGMQLLFTESEEFGCSKGLGIIDGYVQKFPSISNLGKQLKVPQIAWNQIYSHQKTSRLWEQSPLKDIKDGEYMYFVHSFFGIPESEDNILTTTCYEDFEYCSSVIKGNVYAMQFHPEKSAQNGIKLYQNWMSTIDELTNIN
jgi:imidazole glycerol-phosphate synthase subunit HisH